MGLADELHYGIPVALCVFWLEQVIDFVGRLSENITFFLEDRSGLLKHVILPPKYFSLKITWGSHRNR
jgi:hypothetical protein